MAKSDDNFLRGWCRQVRHALEEGTELGYEAAELILELDELLSPGADDPEVGISDGDGGGGAPPPPDEPSAGHAEGDQLGIPGLERQVEPVRKSHGNNNSVGVPRGTGGRAAILGSPSPVVKRRPRA